MKPTRFRAYAVETVESRRIVDGEKQNVSHDVENPAFEGKVVDGKADFDADKTTITKVAFYGGSADEEVCLGSIDLNKSGKIGVQYVEASEDEDAKLVEA